MKYEIEDERHFVVTDLEGRMTDYEYAISGVLFLL